MEVVKNWLLSNPGQAISQKSCTEMFGFTRLGAIIWELYHHEGMKIRREKRKVVTRYGTESYPMFYWIEKDTQI